jgi:hypothetical protein
MMNSKPIQNTMGENTALETPVKLLYVIGIDPGTKTGLSIYNKQTKQLEAVCTLKVHEAFASVQNQNARAKQEGGKIFVRVEDARKRKRYGANSIAKMQGAGAIKIQCKQWEEFLRGEGISFDLVAPNQIKTKMSPEYFKKLTGWVGRTSSHGRDASALIYGL